jgi:hypothetical protein
VVHRPRLLTDNGSSYVASDLADWLGSRGMTHIRGAPRHPQTHPEGDHLIESILAGDPRLLEGLVRDRGLPDDAAPLPDGHWNRPCRRRGIWMSSVKGWEMRFCMAAR